MDSPKDSPYAQSHNDRVSVAGPSSSILLQPNSSLSPYIIGPRTESHTQAYGLEELGSVSPFPESRSSSPLSFYTANTSSSCPPAPSWYSAKPELHTWSVGASQQEGLRKAPPIPTNSSPLSFHTANTSASYLSARQATTSSTSMSSMVSFPYSVNSVNSYKSRKTVLYPRRAHPMPAIAAASPVSPENVVSLGVRTSFQFPSITLAKKNDFTLHA